MATFKFKEWLFNQLPEYFRERDSYKNGKDEGLLQRYLRIFGEELDDEIVGFARDFTNILDLDTAPDKYLPLLGYSLGSPPDIDGTWATYRKLLKYAVDIYKIKGTLCAYDLLFNLMGLKAQVIELRKKTQILYDNGHLYDDPFSMYDLPCEPCQEYDIAYWSKLDDCTVPVITPIPPALLKKITDIICFLQPIDAKLRELARAINICENYSPDIENETTIEIQQPYLYNNGHQYDNGIFYDDYTVVSTNTYIH